jgi:hypothetical protein
MTDKARALFVEGGKSAAKGRWGEAHAAWLAAWSLKRHYQIAGNLGAAEVHLGRYREAAEHLSFYMREAPAAKVKERQKAQELLVEARKHVGALMLKVEPAGADVLVDGVSVGKTPLAEEVFVNPGARVIEARFDGYEVARVKVDAAAGAAREVPLKLAKSGAGTGAAAPAASGGTTATTGNGGGTANGKTQLGAAERAGGPNKALIIVGTATSAAAVGAGIIFAVVSSAKASAASDVWDELDHARVGCPSATFAATCNELLRLREGRDRFADASVWSFVAGGIAGVGTMIYAFAVPRVGAKQDRPRVSVVSSLHGGALIVQGAW